MTELIISNEHKQNFTTDFLVNDSSNNSKNTVTTDISDKISAIHSNVELVQHNTTPIVDNVDFGTNWDEGNISTLYTWINDCNKRQFIYDYALDKVGSESKKVNVIVLIFGSVLSLITGTNLGIPDNQSNNNLLWGIKITTFILAAIILICSHYSVLSKFDDTIKMYTKYTNDINNFLSIIISMADMKVQLRPDGNKFIMDYNIVYIKLRRDAPQISQTYWNTGVIEYNKYIKNNDIETGNISVIANKLSISGEYGRYRTVKN
jgi:hypothetical protein